MNLEKLIRRNIRELKPYSCARNEFQGEASVYLDANENPFNEPYNRYPDPLQWAVKEKIARLKEVSPEQIMLGNGSDEPIDLAIRIFCEPGKDNVVAMDPSYGMYQVCADINGVEYRKVLLDEDFQLDPEKLLKATDEQTKIVFLCSPNNPSGNLLERERVREILESFEGIVVIDEAYIDFAPGSSWLGELNKYPNLIILQTFSKAWGLASIRCGMAFAAPEVIGLFNKVKYPYNLNILTQRFILEELEKEDIRKEWVNDILEQRPLLAGELKKLTLVKKVYPSDANFLLVRVEDADQTYRLLLEKGIIVRNRSRISLCNNCLRITVGKSEENRLLIEALKGVSHS